MLKRTIIITCEHAGNYIPIVYKPLFIDNEDILETHEGWDAGAFQIAKYLSKNLKSKLFFNKISRLLIEVNRSIDHPQLYSRFSKKLDDIIKKEVLERYYNNYRNDVELKLMNLISRGIPILHLSIHSFTPVLNNIERNVDVGILFDNSNKSETAFCTILKDKLDEQLKSLVILPNVPYHGAEDGFTTHLRTKFDESQYLGIELEINQKYAKSYILLEIQKALVKVLR